MVIVSKLILFIIFIILVFIGIFKKADNFFQYLFGIALILISALLIFSKKGIKIKGFQIANWEDILWLLATILILIYLLYMGIFAH